MSEQNQETSYITVNVNHWGLLARRSDLEEPYEYTALIWCFGSPGNSQIALAFFALDKYKKYPNQSRKLEDGGVFGSVHLPLDYLSIYLDLLRHGNVSIRVYISHPELTTIMSGGSVTKRVASSAQISKMSFGLPKNPTALSKQDKS